MLHFIPFGTKTLEISFGEFTCPHCRVTATYKHKERRKRFLLLGIMPILGSSAGEYVECQRCRQQFTMDVLRGKIPPDIEQMIATLQEKLSGGTSIQEAESRLLESGFEPALVKRYVNVAAGIFPKKCPRCALTFRNDVVKCHKCGHVLPCR
jgi:hypothetical protein